MSRPVATEPPTNAARLVRTRLAGVGSPASANAVGSPAGRAEVLPGQGGVLTSVQLGDAATGWCSDHLEVGASVQHPEPAADQALQVLACVGNQAVVLDGPAALARGMVAGKHSGLMIAFPPSALALIGPGDRVVVEAFGAGLQLTGEDQVVLHSCDPALLGWLLDGTEPGGRLRVRIAAQFSREAAGAGFHLAVADCLAVQRLQERLGPVGRKARGEQGVKIAVYALAVDGRKRRLSTSSPSEVVRWMTAGPWTWVSRG